MNFKKSLEKKTKKRFRGYPIATICLYGPTNKLATKIALGIIQHQDGEPLMTRWYSENDIRFNEKVIKEILDFIEAHGVRSVIMPDKIMGCPHEEGMDYPENKSCPKCVFWVNRNRFTNSIIH